MSIKAPGGASAALMSFARGARGHKIAGSPTAVDYLFDRVFRLLAMSCAATIIFLVGFILWKIGVKALPAISDYDAEFLISTNWNVQKETFGVLPQIWGTLYSSLLALAIGGFAGFCIAILLTQNFMPKPVALVLRTIVEMLAAIPSVVFGLWGIFVVIPAIRPYANWFHENLDWIWFFSTPYAGPGLLPASLVLAIMILPTVASISQDALNLVPTSVRDGVYAMGATRWEATLKVIVPTAAGGIFSALVLGLGRALGETMALAMLIGHSNRISLSLFSPTDTLASLLASHFPEAQAAEVNALMYAALVLLAITLLVNMAGTWLLAATRHRMTGEI